MSALDLNAAIAELRDISQRAGELADLIENADRTTKEPRLPLEPEVGEVVERKPAIDEEIKFGNNNLADF